MFMYIEHVKIRIIYRPEEKKLKEYLLVDREVSLSIKTKNTFKYHYFPEFLSHSAHWSINSPSKTPRLLFH